MYLKIPYAMLLLKRIGRIIALSLRGYAMNTKDLVEKECRAILDELEPEESVSHLLEHPVLAYAITYRQYTKLTKGELKTLEKKYLIYWNPKESGQVILIEEESFINALKNYK
jgi:hypothetical protein